MDPASPPRIFIDPFYNLPALGDDYDSSDDEMTDVSTFVLEGDALVMNELQEVIPTYSWASLSMCTGRGCVLSNTPSRCPFGTLSHEGNEPAAAKGRSHHITMVPGLFIPSLVSPLLSTITVSPHLDTAMESKVAQATCAASLTTLLMVEAMMEHGEVCPGAVVACVLEGGASGDLCPWVPPSHAAYRVLQQGDGVRSAVNLLVVAALAFTTQTSSPLAIVVATEAEERGVRACLDHFQVPSSTAQVHRGSVPTTKDRASDKPLVVAGPGVSIEGLRAGKYSVFAFMNG